MEQFGSFAKRALDFALQRKSIYEYVNRPSGGYARALRSEDSLKVLREVI